MQEELLSLGLGRYNHDSVWPCAVGALWCGPGWGAWGGRKTEYACWAEEIKEQRR